MFFNHRQKCRCSVRRWDVISCKCMIKVVSSGHVANFIRECPARFKLMGVLSAFSQFVCSPLLYL